MRKGTKKLIVAVAAVFAAALLVCLAVLSCVPSRTAGRYVDGEDFSGEVLEDMSNDYAHGGHSSWTAIDQSSFTGGSLTIESGGSYYLAEDVTGNVTISCADAILCLNGYALTGTGEGSVITVGETSTSHTYSLDILDCGGAEGSNIHYYKYIGEEELSDGRLYNTGYDFSDAAAGTADGYVRGGLITGGAGSSSTTSGGGINVGLGCTLNMYGGTVAGNTSTSYGGGVHVSRGTFILYGGTIEGNHASNGGGVALYDAYNNGNGDSYFYMYGGEIKDNGSSAGGGGVYEEASSTSGHKAHFHMYGGIIERNHSAGSGGGVSVQGGSSNGSRIAYIYMYGGTIRNNVCNGSGGGVYLTYYLECHVTGGEITGNRSYGSDSAGGIYGSKLYTNRSTTMYTSTVEIGGPVYIYGNYSKGLKSNLGLLIASESSTSTAVYLTLGVLEDGAKIGVTAFEDSINTRITKTSDKSSEYLQYFYSDDTAYEVSVNGTGSSSYIELVAR